MDTARGDLVPLDIQLIALTASEVLVCFPAQLPDGLAARLRTLVPGATRLEFHCPPSTAPDVILSLLDSGHLVFEGKVPSDVQVFFDRCHGYHVPEWSPLPDPFAAACRLAWNRTAAFVRVQGTIAEMAVKPEADFVILRLAENPHLRLSVSKSVGALVMGQPVTLLGRHDFQFGLDTPLLECVTIFQSVSKC
jgi:hypothetical protein